MKALTQTTLSADLQKLRNEWMVISKQAEKLRGDRRRVEKEMALKMDLLKTYNKLKS